MSMHDFPNAPDSVSRYFEAMMARDWVGLRHCLADNLVRLGPYEDHDFPDPDAYVAFLASVLPMLDRQQIDITRVTVDGGTVHVELTESVVVPGGAASTVRVCSTFEIGTDGKIEAIEVFVRRPTARETAGYE